MWLAAPKASVHDQLAPVLWAMVWQKAVEEQTFSPYVRQKQIKIRGRGQNTSL